MKIRIVAIVLTAIGLGAEAHGQSLSHYIDRETGLSLADAVNGALEREPSLRAARAEIDAARGMQRQAGLRPNPTLMFDRREEPAGTDNQTMIQLSLPLDLFRRSARVAVADHEFEVIERGVEDRIRAVVNDVKMRYGQAAAAIRDASIADELAAAARRELELLRRRVEEGAAPPLERDQLDVETRRLETTRLLSVGRAQAAIFQLKRMLGLPSAAPISLRDPLEALAPAPATNDVSDLRDRPDIREFEARIRLADARVQRAEAEGRIDVSVSGSFMRMDAGFPQRGFGEHGELVRVRGVFRYVSAGAMVMVPLWNRNQGEVAAARAERAAAEARLAAAELDAQAQLAAADAQITQTREALASMAAAVQLARRNLDILRQTYELGRATATDVLTEQRRYLDVEQEYTAALREAFEARVSLEFARGDVR